MVRKKKKTSGETWNDVVVDDVIARFCTIFFRQLPAHAIKTTIANTRTENTNYRVEGLNVETERQQIRVVRCVCVVLQTNSNQMNDNKHRNITALTLKISKAIGCLNMVIISCAGRCQSFASPVGVPSEHLRMSVAATSTTHTRLDAVNGCFGGLKRTHQRRHLVLLAFYRREAADSTHSAPFWPRVLIASLLVQNGKV